MLPVQERGQPQPGEAARIRQPPPGVAAVLAEAGVRGTAPGRRLKQDRTAVEEPGHGDSTWVAGELAPCSAGVGRQKARDRSRSGKVHAVEADHPVVFVAERDRGKRPDGRGQRRTDGGGTGSRPWPPTGPPGNGRGHRATPEQPRRSTPVPAGSGPLPCPQRQPTAAPPTPQTAQPATSASARTLVGVTRTSSSPLTALRRPNSSARSGPM